MEWQPIETAPKDGTPVLVFYRGTMVVAEYSPIWHPDNRKWCVRQPNTPANERHEGGIVTDIDIQCWGDGEPVRGSEGPTHWMPLPEPPEICSGTERETGDANVS